MDPSRPHDILALNDRHFEAGANVTEDGGTARNPGLTKALKAVAERAPRAEVTATRALTADDEGKIIEVDPDGGTVDIQLPSGLAVGFFAQILQVGTGTCRIVAGTPAPTINAAASAATPLSVSEQWTAVTVEVRDDESWLVMGALTV